MFARTILSAAALTLALSVGAAAAEKTKKTMSITAPAKTFQKAPGNKAVGGAATTGVLGSTVAELTAQECNGLGGSVIDTPAGDPKCKTATMCATTDRFGVIRTACIDEVAN